MKADILEEKGAILQRDRETYAIAPHIPGGFLDATVFKKLVHVAKKYNAGALKLTSGQRIAVIGIREDDLDAVWYELKMEIGYAIGLCVRMVKFCPGTTYCRHGKQDAMGLGMKLDRLYHGYPLPAKFKIGVAGCEYGCAAPSVKEIGLKGSTDGWTLTAGGNCGAKPRFGDLISEGLNEQEAQNLVRNIIGFFEGCTWAKKMRLGRVIDKIGLEEFKKAICV
ncbi:MAG: NAD(P)/FAD-dependent oxidoreductase [Desulfomonile tiedjei]|uniref:NAD(P)/FAD-dependent oxidoreductase n=1 Tax=Desulfomonile tiedjei TaxID=2358 RepID=A0A9D6UX48_9BACT|nr:NAD(P)/FAD-dependent oxidoreductase [Desulfomonile tiedjei]